MITLIPWIATGAILFIIIACMPLIWRKLDDEGEQEESLYAQNQHEPKPDEPDKTEIQRLEKWEKVYNHFHYQDRGITFKDYTRKVEAGTWGELAEN